MYFYFRKYWELQLLENTVKINSNSFINKTKILKLRYNNMTKCESNPNLNYSFELILSCHESVKKIRFNSKINYEESNCKYSISGESSSGK